MRHQVQKCFRGIFVGITQHQKKYLVYIPVTRKIISSYDVVFDEMFSSTLEYTSQPYAEAMDMRQAVSYTTYATSSGDKTGNIIMFAHFYEWNLLSDNDLKRRIYDLKLRTIRKAITSIMTIQLRHN